VSIKPLAKIVNGDLLPYSGALLNWNFGQPKVVHLEVEFAVIAAADD